MQEHFSEFETIKAGVPDLVRELLDRIDAYAARKQKIWSHYAGSEILRNWDKAPAWEQAAGDRESASRMFGVALWQRLTTSGWRGQRSEDRKTGREFVVYTPV